MFAIGNRGDKYIDRGAIAAPDFVYADFTMDGNYHDLDLSAIIPVNTKLVHFFIGLMSLHLSRYFGMRQKISGNAVNAFFIVTQVDNEYRYGHFWLAPDSSRIVEYTVQTTDFEDINLMILGWIK